MSRPTHFPGSLRGTSPPKPGGGAESALEFDDAPALPLAEREGDQPLCPEEFQPAASAATPGPQALAREVQQKIVQARATARQRAPAPRPRDPVAAVGRPGSPSRRVLTPAVVAATLLGFGALGGVVWHHQRQVGEILGRKSALDAQIGKVGRAMEVESDPGKLASLEEQLALLTGKAEAELGELRRIDDPEAAKLEQSGDDLDRGLRRILARLNARTYEVPPPFEGRLRRQLEALLRRPETKEAYARKQRHWPLVVKEFSALGLPQEMAYVAWVASRFDPAAQGPSGARGLWQLTETRARELGLRVDGFVDERMDVAKETRAAARHLANLLSEFGDDSFLLAIAGYDEANARAARRVLRQVAQEPGGFRKDKRGFWRLYRLKKLPPGMLDSLEQVLAAAIVGNDPARYGLAHGS